eukprot:scaffold1842_cov148-Amphora_coffeaeformis.AAC.1
MAAEEAPPCHHRDPLPSPRHTAVVLFYRYFLSSEFPILHKHESYFEDKLLEFQKKLCHRRGFKGRVLISAEGVNGTLSAPSMDIIEDYIKEMEGFQLIRDCGLPSNEDGEANSSCCGDEDKDERLFQNIDWKKSSCGSSNLPEPFPDLKVSVVKEIISSGGGVSVDEIPQHGGLHLEPGEFHRVLAEEPNVILIDVRNTFECDIGHFVNPHTEEAAINPDIVKFSMFDDTFCAKQAELLKDKKVLMYCTGGIRCEKASVMLKRRGVEDVSQLKGGIHRYLEEFGCKGYFRGMNFVFDQRVAMTPSECQDSIASDSDQSSTYDVVGKCVSCEAAFDELSGSRICTVCRDPLLVCPSCQSKMREYHCRRHKDWKECYFTFLEVFDSEHLVQQRKDLLNLRDSLVNKNMRRTLMKQVEKIDARLKDIKSGMANVDPNAPRRCRTCMDPLTKCDGLCWGFWKATALREANESTPPILPIEVGDRVEPGPHWNTMRLGTHTKDNDGARSGKVVEVKSWGSGGSEMDSVTVRWDEDSIPENRRSDRVPQIYRFGVIALDGSRLYDVQKRS